MHQHGLCLCNLCIRRDIAHFELGILGQRAVDTAREAMCTRRAPGHEALVSGVLRRERKAA